jgi:hypothetical protein
MRVRWQDGLQPDTKAQPQRSFGSRSFHAPHLDQARRASRDEVLPVARHVGAQDVVVVGCLEDEEHLLRVERADAQVLVPVAPAHELGSIRVQDNLNKGIVII